jgi:23S rRNA (cytidine1920-2'-O)/16S rRNA (cytidine1409-2'-O)-methyltransferase
LSGSGKDRLDRLLVARGLAPTRARARDAILRGTVRVDGVEVIKPGAAVAAEAGIDIVDGGLDHVSRGSLKLAAALDAFGFDVSGRAALDIGASTGGFTEILLERGASFVYAVDVGRDQLHATLRGNPQVRVMEATDARALTPADVTQTIGAVTADVSFISLTLVLPVPLKLAAPGAFLVALVKPQFELGPQAIGKGGIVRDELDRRLAVARVRDFLEYEAGWEIAGEIESPIPGGSGNQEFLLGAVKPR